MSLEMPVGTPPIMGNPAMGFDPAMQQGIVPAPLGVPAPVAAPVSAPVAVQPTAEELAYHSMMAAQAQAPVSAPAPAPAVEQMLVAAQVAQAEQLVAQVAPQPQPQLAPQMAPTAQVVIPNTEVAPVQEQMLQPQVQVQPEIGNINNIGMDLSSIMTPEDEVKLKEQEKVVEPISIGGLQNIGNCKTANWGGFMKILEFISKDLSKEEIIIIDKGTLDTNRDGSFIHCDMKNILGEVSLNITSPSVSTKKLKIIKGGELVQIFKEDATNSYIFCNIENGKILTRVKTRFASAEADSFSTAPTLPAPIYQKEISSNDKEVLKTIISGKSADENDEPYRFGFSRANNTLVSVGVGKDFTHFFQDSSIEVDEYKVYYPFPVSNMDSCIIRLYKTEDKGIWLQTVSNVDFASIVCTEKIEVIDSSIEDFAF